MKIQLTSPVKTAALSIALAAFMFTCTLTAQATTSKNITLVSDTTKMAKKKMDKMKMMEKEKMNKMKKDKMKMKKDTMSKM